MNVVLVEEMARGTKNFYLLAERALRPAAGIEVDSAEAVRIVDGLIEGFKGFNNLHELL